MYKPLTLAFLSSLVSLNINAYSAIVDSNGTGLQANLWPTSEATTAVKPATHPGLHAATQAKEPSTPKLLSNDAGVLAVKEQLRILSAQVGAVTKKLAATEGGADQVKGLKAQVVTLMRAYRILSNRVMQLEAANRLYGTGLDAIGAQQAQPTPPANTKLKGKTGQALYKAGMDAINNNEFSKATAAFKTLIKSYPKAKTYAPEAHYWLGELYLASGDSDLASGEFRQVIELDPTSLQAAQSLLELASIYQSKGDMAHAIGNYNRVIQAFPGSYYSQEANRKVNELKSQ